MTDPQRRWRSGLPERERIVNETVAGVFRGDLDISAALDLIVASSQRALRADRASCYVLTAEGDRVLAVHTTETEPARRAFIEAARELTPARMPVWRVLSARSDPAMIVENVSGELEIPSGTARGLDAGAIIGIRLEHPSATGGGGPVLLGALFLTYRRPRRFSSRDRTAVESLAGMAAVALANARLHATARSHRVTDPLTGLANHRAFQERLAREVRDARARDGVLSLALIDIDRFRQVNEEHGHDTGDRVLVAVGTHLRHLARDTDLVARVGGEEIAWLMPGVGAQEAWQTVDAARQAIARTPLGVAGSVTVSAGVCDTAQAASATDLVRLAEGALYWAKQHGRDVAFLYSPTVVEELSAEDRADRLHRLQALQGIRVLARAVDAKDPLTLKHSERVADLAVALGGALGWGSERLVRLREAGLVHDVGKIGIKDRILFKPEHAHAAPSTGRSSATPRSAPTWWWTCSAATRCRGCAATTSDGTARATPTVSPARPSPTARGCSGWPMPGTL